jgi:glutamate-ammonia-ligase adenylyltransferase
VRCLTGKVDVEGRRARHGENLAPSGSRISRSPQTRTNSLVAQALYSTLTQIIRLCLTGAFDRADVPPGLEGSIAQRRPTCPISAFSKRM